MKVLVYTCPAAVALAIGAWCGSASAQIVMDGTADAAYGAALSVQNTQTEFGDNNRGDLVDTENGGSEINQVFGTIANDGLKDRLYLMVAGNLENNFNKLEIYIDVDGDAGGVNEIVGPDLPASVDGYCCTISGDTNLPDPNDGALQRQDFLKFDAGFFADYYITISNGGENQTTDPPSPNLEQHWAVSAHYADLTEGTSGRVVAAGMQLAPKGLPSTLRAPLSSDYDRDFDVDGSDFLTWQRGFGTGTTNAEGDTDRDGDVDNDDLTHPTLGWEARFGTNPNLSDLPYNPTGPEVTPDGVTITTQMLLDNSPTLPGLSQGELIDKHYALGSGGCTADATDGSAGCIAPELDLALPVDSNDPNNMQNHRDFDNSIDLQMALDNSNVEGVEGGTGAVMTGNPGDVTTGIELSIPLDQLLDFMDSIPSGDIRVTAFINSGGHNHIANQFSGVGVLQGNFGDFPPDLSSEAAGDQFVTIPNSIAAEVKSVPEPTSLMLLALAGAGMLSCRSIRRSGGRR